MKFQSRKFQTYVFSQAAKPLQGGTGKWCVKWLPLPPWHHWRSRASDSSASQHLTCDTNDGDREGELVKINMKDHENACLSSMVNSELWTPSLSQLPFFLDTESCTHSWCAHFYVGMECLRSLAPPFLLVRNPVLDAQTPIGTTSQHTHLWSPWPPFCSHGRCKMPTKLGWLLLIGGGKKNCQLLKTDTKNHPLEVFHQPTSPLYITQKSSPGSGSGTVIGRLHQQTAHGLPQALRAERLQRVAKGEATTEAGDRIAVVGLVPKPGEGRGKDGESEISNGDLSHLSNQKLGSPDFSVRFHQLKPSKMMIGLVQRNVYSWNRWFALFAWPWGGKAASATKSENILMTGT